MQQLQSTQFFWEKGGRKGRSRFNLLLLEYGEYFFEDLSVYYYPFVPDNTQGSLNRAESLKVQGRLKLCSRCLIFEPSEIRRPVCKFSFKNITSPIESFTVNAQEAKRIGMNNSCLFSFSASIFFEMKGNDKVAPYKQIDSAGEQVLFALLHTEIKGFLSKVQQLRSIHVEKGLGISENLLAPLVSQASTVKFDTSQLVDFHENLILRDPIAVRKVKPLVLHPGVMMITEKRIYFQPAQLNHLGDSFQYFDLNKVVRLYKRRYLLRQIGLEFILADGSSSLFTFDTKTVRDFIYDTIVAQSGVMRAYVPLEEITRKWQRREISNYEYLIHLNNEADRSVNDITQYPVFPHIIADYSSRQLNLDSPSTFRDLSKPMGALNVQRLQYFKDRYKSMPAENVSMGTPPPFLYGTHYSTPGYVLYYLVRVAPEHMLCLQAGKFDAPDRMFHSVGDNWESCLVNPADLKELIPEFFVGNGEFLVNTEDLDLGIRHTGERLNDVELPAWAKSPRDFIRKCAKALESDYVSNNLHSWIDLIFGYKQQGQAAIDANNLYYYLTYEGAVDLDEISDPHQRAAIEIQIQEFGQTPKQLFVGPHPCRNNHHDPILLKKASLHAPGSSISTLQQINSPSPSTTQELKSPTGAHSSSTPKELLAKGDPSTSPPGVVHLGDDFRAEVNSQLQQSMPPAPSADASSSALRPGSPDRPANNSVQAIFTGWAQKTASLIDNRIFTSTASAFNNLSTRDAGGVSPSETISLGDNGSEKIAPSAVTTMSEKFNNFRNSIGPISLPQLSRGGPTSASGKFSPNMVNTFTSGSVLGDGYVSAAYGSESTSVDPIGGSALRDSDLENIKLITLTPSDPFQAHADGVSGVSIVLDTVEFSVIPSIASSAFPSLNLSNQSFPKVVIATSSKDSLIKILQADTSSMRIVAKRTFTGSDPALTSCYLSKDTKTVYASSWDNMIYCYSVPNARALSKSTAHDDGVTSFAVDDSEKSILTGAWDGTVKLWSLKSPGIGSTPLAEFYDHENPIQSVSLSSNGKYAAAGADDGKVIIWDCKTRSEIVSHQVSPSARPISAIKWLPQISSSSIYSQRGFTEDKLICCSLDGLIICFDTNNRLFAASQLEGGVNVTCLDSDGFAIFTGCSDGSVRIWVIEAGIIREVQRYMSAHEKSVSAISVEKTARILVTGGEDGNIRVWRTLLS